VTIVERSPGASASYKAGGFLAREWGSGPTVQLHQKSFDLHVEIAQELGLHSFRKLSVLSVSQSKGSSAASWLDGHARTCELDGAAAQVTPSELTTKMIDYAVSQGKTRVIQDTAVGYVGHEDGSVKGVKLEQGGVLEANKLVVALGTWSGVVCEDWFGKPIPMEGIKSTSIVYEAIDEVKKDPKACFCDEDQFSCHLELYPRPDGSLYICGWGGSDYVSGDRLRAGGDCFDPNNIKADPARVEAATNSINYMSRTFRSKYTPDVSQACMRPCTKDALPVMSEIPGNTGCYVSAGHNCWGILWAPICGKAMAELITSPDNTQRTLDLSAFHISRFFSRRSQRGKAVGSSPVGEQW
jgi:glycine/D-amino acid oxidase-like deaminating enzyme